MARRLHHDVIMALLSIMLVVGSMRQLATGQSTQVEQQKTSKDYSQLKPVPLAHLYQAFLLFQSHIDAKAAELDAEGKDGAPMRNMLQSQMQFSDADFAAVRTSSQRLTSKFTDLSAQVKANRAGAQSATSAEQLKVLANQREAILNGEILSVQSSLTPEKRAAFEAFLVKFFAPKKIRIQASPSTNIQDGEAVHP